jgi:hypothetical protein
MAEWKPKPRGVLDQQVQNAVYGVQREGMSVPSWQQQAQYQQPPMMQQRPPVQYPPCPACRLPMDEMHYRQGCRAQQRPPMPQVAVPPPQVQPVAKPLKKKRVLLYVLTATFVLLALATVATAVYFYVTYVR